MSGSHTDTLLLLEAGVPRTLEASDEITLSPSFIFTGQVTLQGPTTVVESETVKISDNHLHLNSGYNADAAQTGGLVVTYDPTTTTDTVAAGGFTAGVPATSNPTIATTGAATFSVGQIVQVDDPTLPDNCGLFEVLSHAANLLTVRGVGTTAAVEDWTQTQFVTDAGAVGTITHVNVAIMRAGTDGAWETAAGNTTPFSFTDLGSGGGNSLDQAYVQGNTITTSAGEGDVIIAGTETVQITASGGLNLDAPFDFDASTFDVLASGAFSVDGGAASNVSTTGANLTLSTITSGDVDILSAGDVDIDGVGIQLDATAAVSIQGATNSDLTVSGTDAGPLNLALNSINAGAGTGNLLLAADDEIDLSTVLVDVNATGAITLDAAAPSNFSVVGADLTLSTTTSGNVAVNSAGNVTIDGAIVSIDGTGATNVSATGAQLQLSTVTSGELDITSAGLLDINAAANMDVDVTGTYDLLATGTGSLDFTGASNLSATSGNLTLSTVTSGGVLITSAGASTYTVPNANAAAWLLTDGTDNYLRVDSVDNSLEVLAPFVDLTATKLGVVLTTDSALVEGDITYVTSAGNVDLADANNGSLRVASAIGVSQGTFGAVSAAQIATVSGQVVPVRFTSAPAGTDNGKRVYLSNTAGQATLTAPSGASTTTYLIGILVGGDGADTTPLVWLTPQLVSKHPSVTDP